MIIWGGIGDPYRYLNDGGRYNPTTDTWALLPPPGSPSGFLSGRIFHSALWTGSEMIIWGGCGDGGSKNDGARFNPATNSWTQITTTGAPKPRCEHSAVWTGSEMIIWSGTELNDAILNDGARYNPVTDTWTPMTTTNALAGRSLPTIWTGSEMIVLEGWRPPDYQLTRGARYNPVTDSWRPITTTNAPYATNLHTAVVWTGSEMIVWGGWGTNDPYHNTGSRYDPVTDTWRPISFNNVPSERSDYTEIWTGSDMIVWGGAIGGEGSSLIRNDGGRYNPTYDVWTPVTTTGAPERRELHTAIWTGFEMIIWGGLDGPNSRGEMFPLGDGARLHFN
jgi:N-acetylneuraminic acid mutarotase